MSVAFCALIDGIASVAIRALQEAKEPFLVVGDVSQALASMKVGTFSVIIVGGASSLDIADSCRRLRAADPAHDTVIVAASKRAEDVQATLDAGADDFFVESLGAEVLWGRLVVARHAATTSARGRRASQEHERFFQLSLEPLCIAGLDGYFKKVNPAWTKALGWSSDELVSRPWLDFVHPDDREPTIAAGSQLGGGLAVIHFTNRYRCKDGSYRVLEWHAAPLVEAGAIYASARDITEALANKEALRNLTESLATTLDSIGDAVIATDRNATIVRMNPIAEELTGWTREAAYGRSLREVLPIVDGNSRTPLENPAERALRDDCIVGLASNTVLVRRDGTEIPIADSCAPIRSSGGKVSGAVLVFRDLTEHRNAEALQAKYQQRLVFLDRMASVGTLAAGVAHEINNPLAYVSANVETAIEEIRALGGGSSSGRMKELEQTLVEAREGIVRVTKIVRGLKTFSRIEEDRPETIDLHPVLELSINMAFNEIRHRARLVKDFGKVPRIEADDARLGQVFLNLLVNAAHAIGEGKLEGNEIRIVTSTDGEGRAVVEVRDTGPGIPPALLSRVFDPFFTTKPVGVGTGLGLAISHNIVTGMGGIIAVKSEVGRGTTFRVTLPPSTAHQESTPACASAPAARTHAATVLVVDDEPAVGMAVRRVLRGHDVTIVNSARRALDLVATGKEFDVVLSDLMMPEMSGMELYEELARAHPKIASRVVFVTGGAFTPEAHAFLDRVGNERMDKPFEVKRLRELVERFVR